MKLEKRDVTTSHIDRDYLDDVASFLPHRHPVVFDVGANTGQSVETFRPRFSDCILHAFEPSPSTLEEPSLNTSNFAGVHLWNCALGSTPGQMKFLENSKSNMSSFLPLGDFGWGEITKETTVDVNTVDAFCAREGIKTIDILKSEPRGLITRSSRAVEQATTITISIFSLIICCRYIE